MSTACSQDCFLSGVWWSWIASWICEPTVYTGLSEVIGSWKIIAISEPRMARMASLVGFRPVMSTSPEAAR